MKEIHFYTDLCDIEQVSDWDLDNMNTDYTSTKSSIDNGVRIVKTTILSFLDDAWDFIENGVRVFIHVNSREIEVKDGMTAENGKEIRKGHRILQLLRNNYFGELK